MLAVHPHREWGEAAPRISANLEGPGWTAGFSDTGEAGACGEDLPGFDPATCLRARLPEAIMANRTYGLHGKAPLGSFTGEMTVPATPLLVEPQDTLRLTLPDTAGYVRIPLRYQVDAETGTLLANMIVDGIGTYPAPLDVAGTGTIEIRHQGAPLTIRMRLQGIGWNYTNWYEHTAGDLVVPPWPSFGITGEGVYGYFDGVSAPGRWVVILAGDP